MRIRPRATRSARASRLDERRRAARRRRARSSASSTSAASRSPTTTVVPAITFSVPGRGRGRRRQRRGARTDRRRLDRLVARSSPAAFRDPTTPATIAGREQAITCLPGTTLPERSLVSRSPTRRAASGRSRRCSRRCVASTGSIIPRLATPSGKALTRAFNQAATYDHATRVARVVTRFEPSARRQSCASSRPFTKADTKRPSS